MKDNLRELAELDEAACVPVNRPNLYAPGWNDCRAVVLALIDAEGDGGAVGCLTISRFRGSDAMVNHDFDYYGNLPDGSYSVYTHPARSGVVSNKDVDEAMLAYNLDCHSRGDMSNARGTAMRAALETFMENRK